MKIFLLFAFAIFLVDSVPIEESGRQEKPSVEPEYLDKLLAEKRYEEFSELLGLDNPRLAMPRNASDETDPAVVDPSFIKGLFEGDILLTPAQEESARQGIRFDIYKTYRWPGKVPYSISTSYTTSQKSSIVKAISTWNSLFSGCVQFVERTNEADYVQIFKGDGCYANLGKVGKQQPLSLANGCLSQGTILHEMDHTCGMIHEQSRHDREYCVKVLFDNIPTDWHDQYAKESADVFENFGPYECGSCMHYPINAPGTNKVAFEWLPGCCNDTSKVGQRTGLTDIDKSKLRALYKCPAA